MLKLQIIVRYNFISYLYFESGSPSIHVTVEFTAMELQYVMVLADHISL